MVKEGRSWSARERNCCFLGSASGRFADVSWASGLDAPDDSRGVALVDWDHDGDLDLWISNRNAPRARLYRNRIRGAGKVDAAIAHHFAALRLRATASGTNRDAIGARVELFVAGEDAPRMKTLRAGEGFLSQSSKWIHFGLGRAPDGEARVIERVRVRWPTRSRENATEEFEGVSPGGHFVLEQGAGRARVWTRPAAPGNDALALRASRPRPEAPRAAARIPLVSLVSFPQGILDAVAPAGSPGFRVGSGEALVLNLWSSRCAPCLEELAAWTKQKELFDRARIRVLTLCVDGVGDDPTPLEAAPRAVERLRLAFPWARATPAVLGLLQHLHDSQLPLSTRLPVPSSFLVDGRGRWVALYKGPVDAETLVADAARTPEDANERFRRAAPLEGIALSHPRIAASRHLAESRLRFQLASDLRLAGARADAERHYRELLEWNPDFPEAWNNLGLIALEAGTREAGANGEWDKAEAAFLRARELRNDFAEPSFNLGVLSERRGAAREAVRWYRDAIERRPTYGEAYDALGVLTAKSGRVREAAPFFAAAIRHEPRNANAHNNLARVRIAENENEEARRLLERARELDPDLSDVYNNLGVVYRRLGDLDAAIVAYERAIELDSRVPEPYNNLGLLLLRRGKRERARESFERALAIDPSFAPARANLTRLGKDPNSAAPRETNEANDGRTR